MGTHPWWGEGARAVYMSLLRHSFLCSSHPLQACPVTPPAEQLHLHSSAKSAHTHAPAGSAADKDYNGMVEIAWLILRRSPASHIKTLLKRPPLKQETSVLRITLKTMMDTRLVSLDLEYFVTFSVPKDINWKRGATCRPERVLFKTGIIYMSSPKNIQEYSRIPQT